MARDVLDELVEAAAWDSSADRIAELLLLIRERIAAGDECALAAGLAGNISYADRHAASVKECEEAVRGESVTDS